MSQVMQIFTRVLVDGDVETLSNKNESISSESFALHVQNVNANSKHCCDLIFCAIDLIFAKYTLRYVLHVNR